MKLFHTAIFTIGVASSAALAQDVVVVGEVHDNPAHHRVQAEIVREVAPKALVFEMLTSGQVDAITPDNRDDPVALARADSAFSTSASADSNRATPGCHSRW